MKFFRDKFLPYIMAMAITIFALSGAVYAQLTVTVTGPSSTTMQAPSGTFTVTAAVTGITSTLSKLVIYRNDVPYQTFNNSATTRNITQNELGQDTYTYRARAYNTAGAWFDSNDFKVTVETPRVFKMGDTITITSGPSPVSIPTTGPNREHDHTQEVQDAVDYLASLGGGTLYFPCTGGVSPAFPGGDVQSIYNIKDTINVPANVTLQGESSEEVIGHCRIYWNDNLAPYPPDTCEDNDGRLLDKPMFKVEGEKKRVRFKDLWLYSRTSGGCYPRYDWERIKREETVGILLNAASEKNSEGNIEDVIFENVSISNFTYAVKATGYSISDVKVRGLRPVGNTKALSINAEYAYDWDVQNVNATLLTEQEALEIIHAGAPTSYTGNNPKLKFLQVNCGGDTNRTPGSCARVKKHGGLYFKGLFHEGLDQALVVENFMNDTDTEPIVNTEPIVLEESVATGEFKNASMKLYLIGNSVFAAPEVSAPNIDKGRMKFLGDGKDSTLIDCGDLHVDFSDVDGGNTTGSDLQMVFTHSERNREGFFLPTTTPLGTKFFPKPHKICPYGESGVPNINEIGGEYFNSGVIPMEIFLPYSNVLTYGIDCSSSSTCAAVLQGKLNDALNHGTVYINGQYPVDTTIVVPSGRQIVGGKPVEGVESELILTDPDPCSDIICPDPAEQLLRINVPVGTRTSGIVIRNLKLSSTQSVMAATGLAIIGDDNTQAAASSDLHFSGLTIEGFNKGLQIGRFDPAAIPADGDPMVDGCTWKNNRFVSNFTAADLASANLSNWNVMALTMQSKDEDAIGWDQLYAGTSMQNVMCEATSNTMEHCIRLKMAGVLLTDFKKAVNVVNALTFGENGTVFQNQYQANVFSNTLLRNNDFSSKDSDRNLINFIGKVHLVSMNNRYTNFAASPSIYQGHRSRVTYCGDDFGSGNPEFPYLADKHRNLYVGVPTLTRQKCGVRWKVWEDVVRWGGEQKPPPVHPTATPYYDTDIPLVGNFYDDFREDIVIYRDGYPSSFFIKKSRATDTMEIQYSGATLGDQPLIGRFIPNERAQVVVWNPNGQWWIKDPDISTALTASLGTSGDIPFVGNFFTESGSSITGDMDEIAVYRPSDYTIRIKNPRSGQQIVISRGADYGSQIQVGDFFGLGYDQVAQFDSGTWNIVDPQTPTNVQTDTLGAAGDTPVAGKYLAGTVAQLGVWNHATQEFIIKDLGTCGTCVTKLKWGSNNFGNTTYDDDDLPLRINLETNSILHRPTTYRQKVGLYDHSIANGQWWIHDPF